MIQRIPIKNLDQTLQSEITKLIALYYEEPEETFARELEDCDVETYIKAGEMGVFHGTTCTPYAIQGLDHAFPGEVFPKMEKLNAEDMSYQVAVFLQQKFHHYASEMTGNPYVLKKINQNRFKSSETHRIKDFKYPSPIFEWGVDHTQGDETIFFHLWSRE